MATYQAMTAHNGHAANAGRLLLGWAHAAGFTEVIAGSSTWTFATPTTGPGGPACGPTEVLESSYRTEALDQGEATEADLVEIAAAWHEWAADPDGFFVCPHGELLAVV
ncbi:MAG: hypothetical protein R2695_18645 [Acidimicrobiales bacterium]